MVNTCRLVVSCPAPLAIGLGSHGQPHEMHAEGFLAWFSRGSRERGQRSRQKRRAGITAPIVGARTMEQLNLVATDWQMEPSELALAHAQLWVKGSARPGEALSSALPAIGFELRIDNHMERMHDAFALLVACGFGKSVVLVTCQVF